MNETGSVAPPYEALPVDEKIVLRALTPADAPELFTLIDCSREHLGEFLSWVDGTRSVEDSLAFITKATEKRTHAESYSFAIVVSGKLAGHISLMHVQGDRPPEIGYWIGKPFVGQGITTTATKALTNFGLETLGLERIIIRVVPKNAASNAIPQKLGYTFAGLQEDTDGPHNHWVTEGRQV